MDNKKKQSDITKSQTTENSAQEPYKAMDSSLTATALGLTSGLPFEIVESINLDKNEDLGLTMLVF